MLLDDNSGSGADHAGSQLWNPPLQAEAFTAEIPEKRSFWKQAEKSSSAKSEAWNLPSVPTACDLPEYEQLHRTFIGIIFANLLLFFGLFLPSVLSHYQQDIQSNMLAKYQYMLEVPVSAMSGNKLDSMLELLQFSYGTKTENEDAEAFSAYSLETLPSKYKTDEVILYGIKPTVNISMQIWRTVRVSIFPVPMQRSFC